MPFKKGHKINVGKIRSKEEKDRLRELFSGEKNPQYGKKGSLGAGWKGGRRVDGDGYVKIATPDKRYKKIIEQCIYLNIR